MMTEDFTKLPVGSLVSEGRTIVLCSLCGRCGALETRGDGLRRCVHVEASMIDKDGLRVDARDLCQWAGGWGIPRAVEGDAASL